MTAAMDADERVRFEMSKKPFEPHRIVVNGSASVAEQVELPASGCWEYSSRSHRRYLALHDIMLEDGCTIVDGVEQKPCRDLRNRLTFLPPGVTVSGYSRASAYRQRYIALFFDDDALPAALRSAPSWQEPNAYFQAPRVAHVLSRLDRAMRNGDAYLDLLVDTAGTLALIELAVGRAPSSQVASGHLSEAQLNAVQAYMEDNLHAEMNLSDLARVAGMSKFHFVRCYRQTTGSTPYRALIGRRIARAKSLLRSGTHPDEVALALGFKGPAQFYRAFKRETGTTPIGFASADLGKRRR